MAGEVIAVVSNDNTTSATAEQNFLTTATSSTTVNSTGGSITNSADIDTTTNGLQAGSMLVYSTESSKWVSTIELDSQEITGGQYQKWLL